MSLVAKITKRMSNSHQRILIWVTSPVVMKRRLLRVITTRSAFSLASRSLVQEKIGMRRQIRFSCRKPPFFRIKISTWAWFHWPIWTSTFQTKFQVSTRANFQILSPAPASTQLRYQPRATLDSGLQDCQWLMIIWFHNSILIKETSLCHNWMIIYNQIISQKLHQIKMKNKMK